MIRFNKLVLVSALAVVFGSAMIGCGKREVVQAEKPYTVSKGEVAITIIESGTIDAYRTVEIKPQATGRLSKLFVDEGDQVKAGQLIALIDPKETQLRVNQGQAQLMGAQSQVDRSDIEIVQRKETAKATLLQAESKVRQLEIELKSQPALMKADVDTAKATLQSAIEERDRLLRSTHPTQRASGKAGLDEAEQNVKNATLQLNRVIELEQKGYVAAREVDTARQTEEVAKARLRSAKEQFDKQEAGFKAEIARADEAINSAKAGVRRAEANMFQLKTRPEDLVNARAEVMRARAAMSDPALLSKGKLQNQASVMQLSSQLEDAQRQLNETEVKSPITGLVTKKVLQIGEMASGLSTFSSGSTIFKIEDRTKMRVKLAVNEVDVAQLVLGMPAQVTVDALPNKTLIGKVAKIAPARQESATGAVQVGTDSVVKYEVEIVLDNNDSTLRSGMSAKCRIDVQKRTNVTYVPSEYLDKRGDEYFISIAPANAKEPLAKPTERKVKIGVHTTSKFEILDGVKVGDLLVKPEFKGPKRKGFMEGPGDDQEAGDAQQEKK